MITCRLYYHYCYYYSYYYYYFYYYYYTTTTTTTTTGDPKGKYPSAVIPQSAAKEANLLSSVHASESLQQSPERRPTKPKP